MAFYNLDSIKYSNYIKFNKVLNTIKYIKFYRLVIIGTDS
jgi:hypothetical protein